MKTTKKKMSEGLTRRDALKLSGMALGGLALGGAMVDAGTGKALAQSQLCNTTNGCNYPVDPTTTQEYTYPTDYKLGSFKPDTPLDADEMRITFLGTVFPPNRRAQQMMSIFVEVGPWVPEPMDMAKRRTHSSSTAAPGCVANYGGHGDFVWQDGQGLHLPSARRPHERPERTSTASDPRTDRKSPLYVWGQSPSGVRSPRWETIRQSTTTMAPMPFARTSGKPAVAHGELQLPIDELPRLPNCRRDPGELGTAGSSRPRRRRSLGRRLCPGPH